MSENIDIIDWQARDSARNCITTGYVPRTRSYVTPNKYEPSGVIIANCVDLGQMDKMDLRSLFIRRKLIDKLAPYIGLQGHKARAFLDNKPLILTRMEAIQLDEAVQEHIIESGDTLTRRERAEKFRKEVIRPTLNYLGMGGDAAEELLLGTALQESNLEDRIQKGGGPGLGFYQVEIDTHNDIWDNYLEFRSNLAEKVTTFLTSEDKLHNLQYNDEYATVIARLQYARKAAPLPKAGDLIGQAHYWKEHYNTYSGAGTPEQYIIGWKYHMGN